LGAWRKFDNSDTYSDAEIEQFKHAYRDSHPATRQFWHELERAAHACVFTRRRINLGNRVSFEMKNGTLLLTLPSGRQLSYPEARLMPGKFEGTRELQYKDNAKGGWSNVGAWYGTLTENVVQATARDLLAAAMLRLEAAGYPIILHVHDEILAEVPGGFGSIEEFQRLLTVVPNWAERLPIAAKAWTRQRYAKTKAATAATMPATTTRNESHAETSSHVERVGELHGDPKRTQRESPIFFNDPGGASNSTCAENIVADADPPPWEGDSAFEISSSEPAQITKDENDEEDEGPAWIDIPLADLIGEPLTNGKMLCPFHDDHTPSLNVYPDRYRCYVCGANGNHLDWLIDIEGMSLKEALDLLNTWDGPRQAPAPVHDDGAKLTFVLRLWEEAQPIAGTLAARYLSETRRIDLAALPADIDRVLRFHPRCPFGPGNRNPCLIALMCDARTDTPTGIQRIGLTADAKKIDRRMLGRSGIVKLWPAGIQLVVGEGIETVLAAATRI